MKVQSVEYYWHDRSSCSWIFPVSLMLKTKMLNDFEWLHFNCSGTLTLYTGCNSPVQSSFGALNEDSVHISMPFTAESVNTLKELTWDMRAPVRVTWFSHSCLMDTCSGICTAAQTCVEVLWRRVNDCFLCSDHNCNEIPCMRPYICSIGVCWHVLCSYFFLQSSWPTNICMSFRKNIAQNIPGAKSGLWCEYFDTPSKSADIALGGEIGSQCDLVSRSRSITST